MGDGVGKREAREVLRSSPDRIRTGVTALRGRRPRPLDDGAEHAPAGIPARAEIRYHRQRTDYRLGHGEANRRLALPVAAAFRDEQART